MNKSKAAVVYISGQSNAHAHAQKLPTNERIMTPLKNVFALDRNPNQSFDDIPATWSNFTCEGKNLGESQDNTASFAYYFAKRWQQAIDNGKELPDLYIVQISIGAEGIIDGMWNKDWFSENTLIPGCLGTVKISLYPLAKRVFSAVHKDLSERFDSLAVLGWHWIGSEGDQHEILSRSEFCTERYDDFFDTMLKAIGFPCPVYFYKLLFRCDNYNPKGRDAVNEEFKRQIKRLGNAHMVCADYSPFWQPREEALGIFAPDRAHYLAETQQWFADSFFEDVADNLQFI